MIDEWNDSRINIWFYLHYRKRKSNPIFSRFLFQWMNNSRYHRQFVRTVHWIVFPLIRLYSFVEIHRESIISRWLDQIFEKSQSFSLISHWFRKNPLDIDQLIAFHLVLKRPNDGEDHIYLLLVFEEYCPEHFQQYIASNVRHVQTNFSMYDRRQEQQHVHFSRRIKQTERWVE